MNDTDKLTCSIESQTLIIGVDSNKARDPMDVCWPNECRGGGEGQKCDRVNSEAGIGQHISPLLHEVGKLFPMHSGHNMIVHNKYIVLQAACRLIWEFIFIRTQESTPYGVLRTLAQGN